MTAPKEIAELASHIAKQALTKEVNFTEKVEALKVLTAYTALVTKNAKADDTDEGPNFNDFQNRVKQINGETRVPSRRG